MASCSINSVHSRECWHEQQFSFAYGVVSIFGASGPGHTRRHEVSTVMGNTLKLSVGSEENGTFLYCATAWFDSNIQSKTLLGFEQRNGENKRVLVCCGLRNGTVAMFELKSIKS